MTPVCFGIAKVLVSMTFVCLGIAKLECQISLGISFLSLICLCAIYLKEKYVKKKIKSKKIKNTLKMVASIYSRTCGNYRMYFEGDSLHQAVMIVCELKWFSQISNRHNMNILMQSCDIFHTQHAIFFAILDMCKYNVIWPSHGFTCVNVCSLNCLDFFLKYKNWLDLLCVCVCVFLRSMCLKFLWRDVFESLIGWFDHWLSCMLDCIHVCVFHILKN